MKIDQLWRYPVKSMAGERLERAIVSELGIAGDRVVVVKSAASGTITSRTHPTLLGHKAILGQDGEPLVDGHKWTDQAAQRIVTGSAGEGAHLVRDDTARRFDILPLLVATDGAIAAFGYDSRRLRPNIVVGDVEGLAERDWPGKVLRIGPVTIGIRDLRGRRIMTTFDPDTLVQDKEILQGIYERFEGKLALNAFVIQGGEIRVGDAVELHSSPTAHS